MIFEQKKDYNEWIPRVIGLLEESFVLQCYSHTLEDVIIGISNGGLDLWVAHDGDEIYGVVVTLIEKGAGKVFLNVLHLAGNHFDKWILLFDNSITEYALQHGCHAIEAITRRGFLKILPGVVEDGVICVKLLGVPHVEKTS